jgi:hypothetical protein
MSVRWLIVGYGPLFSKTARSECGHYFWLVAESFLHSSNYIPAIGNDFDRLDTRTTFL